MIFFDFHHHQFTKKGIFNLGLKEDIASVYFSLGLHPKDITDDFEADLELIKEKSRNPNCLAIGECGLDALVEIDENLQELVFEKQILWANEIEKPVIIHCVRRFSQLLKFKKTAKVPMIIHGFNKKENIAKELVEAGFYLSFGKALLYNEGLQELVKNIPLEKVFLETDVSEIDIKSVYEMFAKLREISMEELQSQIKINLKNIFGKDVLPLD